MKFIIVYAGIPHEVYDQVYKNRDAIVRQDGEFIGKPLKPGVYSYNDDHSDYFLRMLQRRIFEDHHNTLGDTAFVVVCVGHDEQSTARFMRQFFPATLTVQVDWTLTPGRQTEIAQSGNRLIHLLTSATIVAKSCLEALKKEVRERANKTPILLPLKNFKSKSLRDVLWSLQNELSAGVDPTEVIQAHVRDINLEHPLKSDDPRKPKFYLDEREIVFRAPGRARHAFSRPQPGHPVTCLLAGHRRLGAPYDPAFHYDCTKGGTNLKGNFFGCHENVAVTMEGDPHLNIAPNDFVRA